MAAPYHAVEHTACSTIFIMPTQEEKEDRKQAPKGRPRTSQPDENREVPRERAHADPLADEYPSICRGID